MVLQGKHTQVAYRCPSCGYAIFGLVTPFSVSQNLLRLKCQCGESSLGMQFTRDKKVRMTVPCLFCQQEHNYTVSQSLFFGRDQFLLACPYTNMDICFMGTKENIDQALKKSEEELMQLFAQLGAEEDEETLQSPFLPDAQIYDILRFVVKELEAEGHIHCPCKSGPYELDISEDGVRVYCTECGASYVFLADSVSEAEAFLQCDELHLTYTP
ncbi:MAG: hypothetical protein J6R42_02740 [Clostridia bacterium]|nr:hypothetical protein [Clostridia bacterium]